MTPILAAWARLCWVIVRTGYAIRPYDMLADRRRWCWQPRTRCASIVLPEPEVDSAINRPPA